MTTTSNIQGSSIEGLRPYTNLANWSAQQECILHLLEDEVFLSRQAPDEKIVIQAKLFFLDYFWTYSQEQLKHYASLREPLEAAFVAMERLSQIDQLEYLVTTQQDHFDHQDYFTFQLKDQGDNALAILDSYFEAFRQWWTTTIEDHQKTQEELRERFSEDTTLNETRCQCSECVHIFRTRLRETVYERLKNLITGQVSHFEDLMVMAKIDEMSFAFQKMRRDLDKSFYDLKYKLKRSSLNKLESDLKGHLNRHFGSESELVKVYREKVKAYLNGVLIDEDLGIQELKEDDYLRFFKLLNTNIWRVSSFLRKEFLKFITSVLAFRRKDISSTILREYLGQFWVHSPARALQRHIVYHLGPTNSGKTFQAIEALCRAPSGTYLAPLRLLASELYDTMNSKGTMTTLLTGEEVIEKQGATHFSSTIEMAKLHQSFDCCVIDEIQMISDPQRGWAWTRALINMRAPEIHLCGDGSVLNLVQDILKLTGDHLEVKYYERMTELKVEDHPVSLKELQRSDALIVFSRRNALKYKAELEKQNFKVSVIYGMLSPEVRREQARKFDEGETDIIVSTDAIAMGMNLPVKRIVFSSFSKFIDGREYQLSMSDVKQISGRAGRYGRFPTGLVTCLQSAQHQQGLAILRRSLTGQLEDKTQAMVGPDLDIFRQVNDALTENKLKTLDLSEFLRLFYTMSFIKPFNCVQLSEMIEITEMVEKINESEQTLSMSEIFGFACAPVNLGLIDHVQYFLAMVTKFVQAKVITLELIDAQSTNIDYLETAIKCMELYQWLARHFDNKNFSYDRDQLQENKLGAIEQLNFLLSEKSSRYLFNVSDRFSFDREKRNRRPAPGGGSERQRDGAPTTGGGAPHHSRPRGPWKNRKRR